MADDILKSLNPQSDDMKVSPDAVLPTAPERPAIAPVAQPSIQDTQDTMAAKVKKDQEDRQALDQDGWDPLGNGFALPGTASIQNAYETAVHTFNTQTTLGKIYNNARLSQFDPDPAWTDSAKENWMTEFGIAPKDRPTYYLTQSASEANAKYMEVVQQRADDKVMALRYKNSPVVTTAASLIGGAVDFDTVLAGVAGKLNKAIGIGRAMDEAASLGRLSRSLRAGITGAATLGASQGVGDAVSLQPTDKASEMGRVLGAAAMGFGFSAGMDFILGGKAHKMPSEELNQHVNTAADDVADVHANPDRYPWTKEDPDAQKTATPDPAASARVQKTNDDLDAARQAEIDAEKARQAEAAAARPEGAPASDKPKPQIFDPRTVELEPHDPVLGLPSRDPFTPSSNSSAGAAQANPTPHNSYGDDVDLQSAIADARAHNARIRFDDEYQNGFVNVSNSPIHRMAQRFHDVLRNTPGLRTDYDKLANSGSEIAKMVAYQLQDNASGLLRNNSSAAGLKANYMNQLLGQFHDPWNEVYQGFAQSRGVGNFKAIFNSQLKEEFNREVWDEMSSRFHDGRSITSSPHVKNAADILDRYFSGEIPILKGMSGEIPVHGSDALIAKSGYMPHRWDANKIVNQISNSPNKSRQQTVDAIAAAIQAQNSMLTANHADVWARAVVDSALRRDAGITTSPGALFATGGADAVAEFLRRNGVGQGTIGQITDALAGRLNDAGRMSTLKHRIDLDPRSSFNGIKMLDLMETDIPRIVMHRAHGIAGQSALARVGYAAKEDVDRVISNILKEQQFSGKGPKSEAGTGPLDKFTGGVQDWIDSNKPLDEQSLREIFEAFTPSAEAINGRGAVGAGVRRMQRISNLMLLTQNGLAQLAETGPLIAQAGGFQKFLDHAGNAFKAELHNAQSPLIQELKHMNTMVFEENLVDPTMWDNLAPDNQMMSTFDKYLNMGVRGQGWWSGMFHVRRIQHNIAVSSMADRIMRNLAGYANDLSPERLKDMGLSDDMGRALDPNFVGPQARTLDTIRKYIANGTIQFMDQHGNIKTGMAAAADPNVTLHKLNMDKWHGAALQDFKVALNRAAALNVQRAMAGESNTFMSRHGIASMFMHLKTYPALAIQKQFLRQIRHGDMEAQQILLAALATAGIAYTVKQVVNGNTDNLDPVSVGKGAFNMSNAFGWIPMLTDPVANMFGMPQLTFNNYYGAQKDIIGAPASFAVANNALRAPGAVLHAAGAPFGLTDFSTDDKRALKMVLGPLTNYYGVSGLYNSLMYNSRPEKETKPSAIWNTSDEAPGLGNLLGM